MVSEIKEFASLCLASSQPTEPAEPARSRSGYRAATKAVLSKMKCVSASGILLLCCFGDLVETVLLKTLITLYTFKYSFPIHWLVH